MPVLDIEIVVRPEDGLPKGLAAALAEAAAEIFGSGPGQTWVKVRPLPLDQYAENGGLAEEILPVFVTVLKAQQPAPEQRRAEARQLAETLAQVCARPAAHVHVLYLPDGDGRIAFGGQLLTGDGA